MLNPPPLPAALVRVDALRVYALNPYDDWHVATLLHTRGANDIEREAVLAESVARIVVRADRWVTDADRRVRVRRACASPRAVQRRGRSETERGRERRLRVGHAKEELLPERRHGHAGVGAISYGCGRRAEGDRGEGEQAEEEHRERQTKAGQGRAETVGPHARLK
jgi:hypothetical protein